MSVHKNIVLIDNSSVFINKNIVDGDDIIIIETYFEKEITSIRAYINGKKYNIKGYDHVARAINGKGDSFIERVTDAMNKLPNSDVNLLLKEYSKYINDGVILDGFVGGLVSVITFISLYDEGVFAGITPLQFNTPHDVLSRNGLSYLSLAIEALIQTTNGKFRNLFIFMLNFINMWETIFIDGREIPVLMQGKLILEASSCINREITKKMVELRKECDRIKVEMLEMERRCQGNIDNAFNKVSRNVSNLIVDANQLIESKLATSLIDVMPETGTIAPTTPGATGYVKPWHRKAKE